MPWPFSKAPEPIPVEPPPPAYERMCICGSKLFSTANAIVEQGGQLRVTPPVRIKCVRCNKRIDETNWEKMTRRIA